MKVKKLNSHVAFATAFNGDFTNGIHSKKCRINTYRLSSHGTLRMSQNPVSAFPIDIVLNFDTSIDIVSNAKVKVNSYWSDVLVKAILLPICVSELLLEIAPAKTHNAEIYGLIPSDVAFAI